ncbi:hypothetical protein ACWGLE_34565 [Streptomyces sp. NPDC055897]
MSQLHCFDSHSEVADVSKEQLQFHIDHLQDDEATEFCVDYDILKSLTAIGAGQGTVAALFRCRVEAYDDF